MPALFEQYRPREWSEVVGQDKVLERIGLLRKRGLAGRAFWISGQRAGRSRLAPRGLMMAGQRRAYHRKQAQQSCGASDNRTGYTLPCACAGIARCRPLSGGCIQKWKIPERCWKMRGNSLFLVRQDEYKMRRCCPLHRRHRMISEQLKRAVRDAMKDGTTRYQVAKNAGVDYMALHRFLEGSDARVSTIDALAASLGLELRPIAGEAAAEPAKPSRKATKKR